MLSSSNRLGHRLFTAKICEFESRREYKKDLDYNPSNNVDFKRIELPSSSDPGRQILILKIVGLNPIGSTRII